MRFLILLSSISLPFLVRAVETHELPPFEEFRHLVAEYCGSCHGPEEKESGIDYTTFLQPEDYQGNLEVLEAMDWMIEEHEMPPAKADKFPSDAEREKMVAWVQGTLLAMQNASPNDPGLVVMPRLTNAEFDNVIRDLTGISIPASSLLPGEPTAGEGFANVGQAQDISPARVEKYLDAAGRVLAHARVTPERGLSWHEVEPRKAAAPRDLRAALIDEWVTLHRNEEDELFNFRQLERKTGMGIGWYLHAAWMFQNRDALGMGDAGASEIAADVLEKHGVRLVPRSIELTAELLGSEELSPAVRERVLAPLDAVDPGSFDEVALKDASRQAEEQIGIWSRVRLERDGDGRVNGGIRQEGENDTAGLVIDSLGGSEPFLVSVKIEMPVGKETGSSPMSEVGIFIRDTGSGEIVYDSRTGEAPESIELGEGIYEFSVPERARGASVNVSVDKEQLGDSYGSITSFNAVPEESPGLKHWSVVVGVGPEFDELASVARFGRELIDRRPYSGAQPLWLKHQNYIFFRGFDAVDLRYLDAETWPGGEKGVHPEEIELPERVLRVTSENPLNVLGDSLREAMDEEALARVETLTRELVIAAQKPHQDLQAFLVEQGMKDAAEGVLPDAETIRSWPAPTREKYEALVEEMAGHEREMASHAREQLSSFAGKAWREPIDEETIDRLGRIYFSKRSIGGSYDASVKQAMKAVLISPRFLYRVIRVDEGEGRQQLDLTEFADRMAAFLWASRPDSELLELAEQGKLLEPEALRAQIQRMVEDPRAESLATEFAGYWLGFAGFEGHTVPNPNKFPTYDEELRVAMAAESTLFFRDLFENDGPVTAIYDADYTFLNERLAKHYGIEGVDGDHFRKVTVDRSHRGGIFGMGSLLTKTSTALRTSPVLRGTWILTSVMGQPLPEPPPNVGTLSEDETSEDGLTITQQLALHRDKEACSSCHERIDPQGIALENFDPIGRWRTEYAGDLPVDPSSTLKDGTEVVGLAGLRAYVREREDEFVMNFCRKLLGYALGRPILLTDRPLLEDMGGALREDDLRVQSAIVTILQSPQFRQKRVNPRIEISQTAETSQTSETP